MLAPAVLVGACSSVTPAEKESAASRHVLQKNFVLDEPRSVAVGETMVSVRDYYVKDRRNTWTVGEPATLRVGLGSMELVPGEYTATRQIQVDGIALDAVEIKVHPFELTTLRPSSGVVPMTFFIDDSGRVARSGGGFGLTTEVAGLNPPDFRARRGERTSIDATRAYTNFELLYSGSASGAVKLTYREYRPNDLSHPASFQDLTYNLADKSVRFKDVLIEVNDADNQAIHFRVKSVPQEWMQAGQ